MSNPKWNEMDIQSPFTAIGRTFWKKSITLSTCIAWVNLQFDPWCLNLINVWSKACTLLTFLQHGHTGLYKLRFWLKWVKLILGCIQNLRINRRGCHHLIWILTYITCILEMKKHEFPNKKRLVGHLTTIEL